MKRSSFCFTLIEMLGVIAIIAILAGIAIPVVFIGRAKGRETQAKNDINAIIVALKSADKDYGRMIGTDNKFMGESAAVSGDVATVKDNAFYAMILEFTVPKNLNTLALNKRKKTYLDAKKDLNPEANAISGNEKSLYQDPWGNPYIVMINTKKKAEMPRPKSSGKIAAVVAVYSKGPNGKDDGGCNADLETCIGEGVHKDHDDIASWNF